MATIDIRGNETEEITAIIFSDESEIANESREFIRIKDNNGYYLVFKSDIPNLISALMKAEELGWY